MIAASAIEQGNAVVTGNTRQFQKIPGLMAVPF
jgi:predicted nucleic acid-binding protein